MARATLETRLIQKTVFPVLGGSTQYELNTVQQVYGTAFPVADKVFLTAGHCVQAAAQGHELAAIGYFLDDMLLRGKEVENHEVFKEYDLGILVTKEPVPHLHKWEWDFSERSILSDVFTYGYPLGFDVREASIRHRGFKGYIVGLGPYYVVHEQLVVYEVSFQAPAGLSGAPLLAQDNEKVVGVVFGCNEASIKVNTHTEHEGAKTIETRQTVHYGLACPSMLLAGIESELLGTSLGVFLIREGLVSG